MAMNLDDFKNLDAQNFGNWPIPVKGVIVIILCAGGLFAGYWFDTQHQIVQLSTVQKKEDELKKSFKDKQWKAAALPKLKEQLKEIEATIKEQKNRLPSEAEVAELITEISQQTIASGLQQELFEPQYKKKQEKEGVYEELPIRIKVIGDYHAFGKFISGVAAMPRIVTQHDIFIQKPRSTQGDNKLIMDLVAKVYRYLEEQKPAEGEEGEEGEAGKDKEQDKK
ncbi:MAG: type 4a pilus biogenesis protein PilO [Pseudomonadota bacterium]|nr:type 4a pilus biogenesis protein PilO [Pseudomonadota bacterium]